MISRRSDLTVELVSLADHESFHFIIRTSFFIQMKVLHG